MELGLDVLRNDIVIVVPGGMLVCVGSMATTRFQVA